jgi:hypothetical protein
MKLRKALRKGKKSFQYVLLTSLGKEYIHFLHIGKTGGTAVKHAINEAGTLTSDYKVELHPHHVKLKDVKPGEGLIFFLRDPIKRFTSGYFSRQRQGKPRYFWPWNEDEKLVFETFTTPNDLALGLASDDPERKRIAEMGMRGIKHIKDSFWDWFGDEEYFKSRSGDIFFIGFQESLNDDFIALKKKLGLAEKASLPNDNVKAHKNPESANTRLSEEAISILKEWYKEDYRFMEICKGLIQQDPSLSGP